MLNMVNMAAMRLKVFVDTLVFDFKNKEKGAVDIVAIIILIAVAVAIALIFKDKLAELVNSIMGNVNQQANNALNEIGG